MVDHIRQLLLNPPSGGGYAHIEDGPSNAVMALFGLGGTDLDSQLVDRILPLALAPDLTWARDVFDPRLTPPTPPSVYRSTYEASDPSGATLSLSLDGLYDRIRGQKGWWAVSVLFSHPDPLVQQRLSALREAAMSMDSAYALGAVLLACAYRRWLLSSDDGRSSS